MKTTQTHQNLEKILSSHFFKYSLIPIFVVEISLLVLYFSINAYISSKNIDFLFNEAKKDSRHVLQNEAHSISEKLYEVSRMATLLQKEHQSIFKNPNNFGLPNGKPEFSVAPNGVYFKTNTIGASIYYSSQTPITQKEEQKAIFTEAMDISLQNIVDINPNIVAAYFNSWDDMNRLYPFIDKVYEQYGSHIHMEDYNFYYLADAKHNPSKKSAWTSAYLDPAGNGWMLSCLVPIYNNDFLEGVTGLDITIDVFVKNLLEKELPYDANLFMVDKDGMIIAMSEKIENLLGLKELKEHLYTDAILKTIEKPEEFNIITNKSDSAHHFKNMFTQNLPQISFSIDNKEYLALQQTVLETDWKIIILIDKNNIFASIKELEELSNIIGYFAIAFLLIFYIIFFYLLVRKTTQFSKIITQPISQLSDQTSKITTIEVLDTNITEINTLSKNFVYMMQKLDERTLKLQESNKAKDDFLANMSHELKTPLNSINVISSIMMKNTKKLLTKEHVQNLSIINHCGNDLLFLINDVLDVSKLEAGKITLVKEIIDFKKTMNDLKTMFEPQLIQKNIKFIYNYEPTIGNIYNDEQRIKQVIKNLLSNAVKFAVNGTVELRAEDDEQYVKVTVKDNGIGIAQEKLSHIFDRFKQVDESTTRKYGGTGLGLAICKELSQLLGGSISVTSEENKGSSFVVTIAKNTHEIEMHTPSAANAKKEDTQTLATHTILQNTQYTQKKATVQDTQDKTLILLHNDPIAFMKLSIDLKKEFTLLPTNTLQNFLASFQNETIPDFALIDTACISQEELLSILEKITLPTLLVIDAELSIPENKHIIATLQKPLKAEKIQQILSKKSDI